MRRLVWSSILVGFLGLLGVTPALALRSDFVPASQTVFVGQPVSVDVVISGTVRGSAPSIGAFDLDVSFDPHNLSATGVIFGPFLGIPNLLTDFSINNIAGVVGFAEVSLLLQAALDALQPDSFILATLAFIALAPGRSVLTLFPDHRGRCLRP